MIVGADELAVLTKKRSPGAWLLLAVNCFVIPLSLNIIDIQFIQRVMSLVSALLNMVD